MSKKLIICCDFDDTLFERGVRGYPQIGSPIMKVIQDVKHLKALGHTIILWTCRDGDPLVAAVKACADLGLEFDAVNDNLDTERHVGLSRKIYANIYIDDKAINPLYETIYESALFNDKIKE